MPEIQELLQQAARPPRHDVDVLAVMRRGTALRRREHGAAVSAVVVAVVLPLSFLLQREAGEARVVPAPAASGSSPSTTSSPGPETTRPGLPNPGPAGPLPTISATAGGAVPSTTQAASPPPGGEQPTAGPRGTAAYPLRQDCVITLQAVPPGQSVTCKFTAAAAGGWASDPGDSPGVFAGYDYDMQVTIQHAGVIKRYGRDVDCGTAKIQPGDLVTLMLKQYSKGYSSYTLSGGAGHSC